MSVELVEFLFDLGIILWVATMLCLVLTFIMHALVLKSLLHTYFKEPYFSPAEIGFFYWISLWLYQDSHVYAPGCISEQRKKTRPNERLYIGA